MCRWTLGVNESGQSETERMHGHNKAVQAKVGASEGAKELCGKQEDEGKAMKPSPEEKKEMCMSVSCGGDGDVGDIGEDGGGGGFGESRKRMKAS